MSGESVTFARITGYPESMSDRRTNAPDLGAEGAAGLPEAGAARLSSAHPTGLSFGTRIYMLVAVALFVAATIGTVAIVNIGSIRGDVDEVALLQLPIARIAADITLEQDVQEVLLDTAVRLAAEGENYEAEMRRFMSISRITENDLADAERRLSEVKAAATDPIATDSLALLAVVLDDITDAFRDHNRLAGTLFARLNDGSIEDIQALRAGIRAHHATLERRTRDLLARIEAISVMTSESAVDRERTTIILIAVFSAAGLALCGVLGVALKRSIVRPLLAVGSMLEQLADGDTNVAVDGLDRSGELAALTDAVETFRREIIRRRRTESALRQSEERYRFAVDESPAAILIHDQGQVVYANTAAMDLFGSADLRQLVGRPVLDLIDPAFRQIAAGRMRRVQRGAGKLPLREAAIVRLDGTSIPIEMTGARTVFDGRPCVQSVYFDITRRKQAEAALYRNERTLRRLHEITATTQLSTDQKIARILDLGLETLDLDIAIVSRIEGDTYAVEYARGPEYGPRPGKVFPLGDTYCADTLATDGPLAFHAAAEGRWRNHPCYEQFGLESYIGAPLVVDGRRYGTLNFSSPSPRTVAFSESEISLIQLLAQWIGGEKSRAAAVEALGVSEERLKLALEGSNDGLWDWNVVTGDMYFSPRWQTMLGYRPGEVEGHARNRERMIHPDDKSAVMSVLREHLKGRTATYETEHRVRTRSGEWMWILDRGKVVERDGSGRPLRTVGTITDIGERKRVERMKTEFVSTVSHELRTPLTSIHGSLGLVLGGAVGDVPVPARELLRIAESNSERLIGLVNDILDIEKTESGRMEFRMEVVDLNVLTEQVVTANRAYADRLGVRVDVAPAADSAEVVGDPARLAQVVTNLLSNAAKFSPEGETVEVAVRRDNGVLRVEVADRGPGIPESFRERVFEKSTQADSSDTRSVGGTGLGLRICRAIIDAHGGTIGYESDPGSQTRFHFELPQYEHVQSGDKAP